MSLWQMIVNKYYNFTVSTVHTIIISTSFILVKLQDQIAPKNLLDKERIVRLQE